MKRAGLFAAMAVVLTAAKIKTEPMPVITVNNEVLNPVDPRLFGQFLERASFGESGPEAATDGRGNLRRDCMDLLKRYAPPVIRFPGGTDIDFIDWTDMIDNVPGRKGDRPPTAGHTGRTITNRFGYDEYFRLRDLLGCQSVLVLNLLDGMGKKKPLLEAARHAAGLVAYANADQGKALPDGMPDWPAVRADNGHPAPFKADFIQLGNEWWCGKFAGWTRALFTDNGKVDADALAAWAIEVLHVYIRTIRAIDPDVPLIIDGKMWAGVEETVLSDPLVRKEVTYITYHAYAPMDRAAFFIGDDPVPFGGLNVHDAFTALSSMPGTYGKDGQNDGFGDRPDQAVRLGYRVCYTEWNWNGWGFRELERTAGLPWHEAASLGVAAFIHGMMGSGAYADFANQSMLLGHGWDIAAVKYDPDVPGSAHFGAQGRTSLFYKEHSGTESLRSSQTGVDVVTPVYRVGKHRPPHPTAMIESGATRKGKKVYVHLINRYYEVNKDITIDLKALGPAAEAVLLVLKGREKPTDGPERWLEETSRPVYIQDGACTVTLPQRSVCCLEADIQ